MVPGGGGGGWADPRYFQTKYVIQICNEWNKKNLLLQEPMRFCFTP